ncbi:hypothetical protein DPSP01_001088 [Paraphaeosphaeria sporulosa]
MTLEEHVNTTRDDAEHRVATSGTTGSFSPRGPLVTSVTRSANGYSGNTATTNHVQSVNFEYLPMFESPYFDAPSLDKGGGLKASRTQADH